MIIDQQVALDEALIPHASRLRIGKSNFRLRLDITSKESTLHLVYDVLRLTPFYKAFLVITDSTSGRCCIYVPRIPNQTFDELSFKEEILAFLRYLGHSKEIKKITDVNINKLHQPWRSFAAVINKYLSGKSTGYDSLRLSQAQILWACTTRRMWTLLTLCGKILYIKLSTKMPKRAMRCTTPDSQSHIEKQQTHISQASRSGADEGTGIIPGVLDVPTDESDEEISWKSSDEDDDDVDDQNLDNDGDNFVHPKLSTHDEKAKDEESFDPIVQTPSRVEESDNESNDDECHGMNVGGDEGPDAEDDDEELYRDVNINLEGRDVQMTDVHTTQVLEDTHVTLTLVNPDGQQQSSSMSSQFVTSMFNPSPDVGIDSLFKSTPRLHVPIMTTVVPLLVTAPSLPPPFIPIMSQVQQAPTPTPTTTPSSFLQDLLNFGSLFGFDHRLKTLEANFSEFMQTNQFTKFVSSILGIVDRYINHQMNEAVKVAVQLQSDRLRDEAQAENEDFINKLDENIQKILKKQLEAEVLTRSSNSSKTSYVVAADLSKLELKKILIEKMESNKSIHRSDEQRNLYKALMKNPPLDQIGGPREGKEPESTSAPKEKASKTTGKSTEGSKSHQKTTSESRPAEEPMQTTQNLEDPSHQEFETGAANDQPIVETSQQPKWFQKQTKPPTPNFAWNKTLLATHRRIHPWISDLAKQVDSRCSFNELMDTPIKVCRDDDKLYKFKEGDFKRLRIQDIEDMLLLLVQGKVTNLIVKERFAFNVSFRMFTRSIVIQRRVEDLQLGVESYQKKLNLIKPNTYRTDLKRKESYTAYSNPRGFIYQNKDKQNRLMHIDELHKFSDDTLNDVRTALDDHLKGIRMKYLPQTIWRRSDKERAAAMIQAIDKQLKTRRIMRSLEKFVGRRLYEGDFRMLNGPYDLSYDVLII
nr:hypothetical protein [Tanacetum cinerariifolium]